MAHCQRCHTELEDGERFCPECGHRHEAVDVPESDSEHLIADSPDVEASAGTADLSLSVSDRHPIGQERLALGHEATGQRLPLCPNGHHVSRDMKFCGQCGAPTTSTPTPEPPTPVGSHQTGRKLGVAAVIGLATVVIAITVAFTLVLTRSDGDPDPQDATPTVTEADDEQPVPSSSVAPATIPPATSVAVVSTNAPTTLPVASPAESLSDYVAAYGFAYNSGVLTTVCGDVAYVSSSVEGDHHFLVWDGLEWHANQAVGDQLSSLTADVEELWVTDLSGDGRQEVVVQWLGPGWMRAEGGVIAVGGPECDWRLAELVDSCGAWLSIGSLQVIDRALVGSGFSGGCSGREDLRFQWFDRIERFVARPYDPNTYMCGDDYTFGVLDLPFYTCEEGWPIENFQYGMRNEGIDVDVDGYFGPGTQLAVIEYQQRHGLFASGLIDSTTWNEMFPVDFANGNPDLDGDGISTPREMMHS